MPLTIASKSIGSRKRPFEDFSVPPPPLPKAKGDGGPLTLRKLIEWIVRKEVEAYNERRVQRRLQRVLSPAEIDAGTNRGKLDPGGRDVAEADPEQAVGAALQAFEDGLYLVFIDEEEHRDLETPIYLQENTQVTFVRLTFLTG